jgi:hypothetical protein
MTECEIFVYGRTKSIDYKWLQKPIESISSSFFAKVLEFNSNSLKKNEKLFIFNSSPELYMLAFIFKESSLIDERGRPISFVIGLTCESINAREFNYRLPALLQNYNLLINFVKNDLKLVVNNNIPLDIKKFDISHVEYKNNLEEVKNKDISLNSSIPDLIAITKDLDINSSQLSLKENVEDTIVDIENSILLKTAKELKEKVETPKILSNFLYTDFGDILKVTMVQNNTSLLNQLDNFENKNNNFLDKSKEVKQVVEPIAVINEKKSKNNSGLMNQLDNFEKNIKKEPKPSQIILNSESKDLENNNIIERVSKFLNKNFY